VKEVQKAAALACAACVSVLLAGSTAATAPIRRSAFALLADGTLLKFSLARPRAKTRVRVDPPPSGPGHYLAFSPSRSTLYALSEGGALTRLSAATLNGRVRAEIPSSFPGPGVVAYRSLAVGPRTGDVYVFANHVLPSLAGGALLPIEFAVVDILDRDLAWKREVAVRGTPYDWRVYRGAVSRTEDRLFVSYHGTTTTGADSVDSAGRRLGCDEPPRPDEGCLRVHGNVEPLGNGVVGSTGEGPLRRFDSDGRVIAEVDPRLPRNHLMEFAVAGGRHTYAVGSCLYSGGLSVVDLVRRKTRVLSRPRRPGGPLPAVCGERIAVAEPYIVIAAPDRLLVVDARNGKILQRLPLAAQPVDVLVR
jgi:hypothetical protein